LLAHSKKLLSEKGQLLFDSSDISYLYDEYRIQRPEYYFGEIGYQYEFNGIKGEPFKWLYLDQKTLIKVAHEEGWVVQILFEDENDQFLVRMQPIKKFAPLIQYSSAGMTYNLFSAKFGLCR